MDQLRGFYLLFDLFSGEGPQTDFIYTGSGFIVLKGSAREGTPYIYFGSGTIILTNRKKTYEFLVLDSKLDTFSILKGSRHYKTFTFDSKIDTLTYNRDSPTKR